jgi:hypothetical protein
VAQTFAERALETYKSVLYVPVLGLGGWDAGLVWYLVFALLLYNRLNFDSHSALAMMPLR